MSGAHKFTITGADEETIAEIIKERASEYREALGGVFEKEKVKDTPFSRAVLGGFVETLAKDLSETFLGHPYKQNFSSQLESLHRCLFDESTVSDYHMRWLASDLKDLGPSPLEDIQFRGGGLKKFRGRDDFEDDDGALDGISIDLAKRECHVDRSALEFLVEKLLENHLDGVEKASKTYRKVSAKSEKWNLNELSVGCLVQGYSQKEKKRIYAQLTEISPNLQRFPGVLAEKVPSFGVDLELYSQPGEPLEPAFTANFFTYDPGIPSARVSARGIPILTEDNRIAYPAQNGKSCALKIENLRLATTDELLGSFAIFLADIQDGHKASG